MRRIFSCIAFMMAVAWLTGCEWESSDGSTSSWNDSYSWINFSGLYSPGNGAAYLVSLHGPVTNSVASTQSTTQSIGTGDGLIASFSGTLANLPVALGSVSVTAGAFSMTDPDADGQLTGVSGSGTINYSTGAITANFAFAPAMGQNVIVSYSYSIAGTPGNPQPGSAPAIYTLLLEQTGNKLSGTDNNGITYNGAISGLAQGGGDNNGTTSGEVVANFSLNGVDGSSIVGTLSGQYRAPRTGGSGEDAAAPGGAGSLSDRKMQGTYIGLDGGTGDVQGSSGTVATSILPII